MKKNKVLVGMVGLTFLLALLVLVRDSGRNAASPGNVEFPTMEPTSFRVVGTEESTKRARETKPEKNPTSSRELEFLVLEQGSGRKLANAGIFRVWDDHYLLLGKTDAKGLLATFLQSKEEEMEFIVRAKNHVPSKTSFRWHQHAGKQLTVRLKPARFLEGEVVWMDDQQPVGKGIHVVAVRQGDSFTLRDARRAFLGDPGFLVAQTRERGEFLLDGLEPEKNYFLLAGGSGGGAPQYVEVSLGDSRATVPVAPAWAMWVRVVEKGGAPIRISEVFRQYAGGDIVSGGGQKSQAMSSESLHSFLLGGLEPRGFGPFPAKPWTFLLLRQQENRKDEDAFFVSLDLPGYKPWKFKAKGGRLGPKIPEYEAALVPESPGWGSLEVRFLGVPEELRGSGAERIWPGLEFDTGLVLERAGSGRPWQISPSDFGGGTYTIPSGDYSGWFFIDQNSGFRYPPKDQAPLHFQVGRGATQLDVDLSELGGLSLEPRQADGKPYQGPLGVRLHWKRNGRQKEFWFDFKHPPYRILGYSPGFYTVEFQKPLGVPVQVFISPGLWDKKFPVTLSQ